MNSCFCRDCGCNMDWYLICNFRRIYAIFGITFLVFGVSEEKLHHRGNVQGSKCPYSVIDFGSSLTRPVGTNQRKEKNVWDLVHNLHENALESKNSSLDQLSILQLATSKDIDCQNELQSNTMCNSSNPYRIHDGTCNNLMHPTWGMALECQLRLLPAYYEGADGFRKSVKGTPLPDPRELSLNIMPDVDHPTQALSHMFVFFGQFVAHDFTLTPTPTRSLDSCCPYDERNRARPECAPIFLQPDDPFYSQFNKTCTNFERSNDCATCRKSGGIQKINSVTAALDLQQVYGKSEEQADELRMKDGTGRLKFEINNMAEIPPRNTGMFSEFCPEYQSSKCFLAGDGRVDQHATLTSMHTLFLREHNRLATELKELNPDWQEETLYQEARKIFGGQWQHMIYNEYLPFAVGPRHMTHFGLWVGQDGTRYNSSTRVGTWLEVSTTGFRLHSMVATRTGTKNLRFYDTFSNPSLIREGCADTLLEGACRVPSQEYDRFFVEDMADFFLKQPTDPYGQDIVSTDIQRGRDHGMPPYVKMVEYLTEGQTKVSSFDDLKVLMSQNHIKLLKKNYDSVDDVDLWVGLQLEKHPSRANLGFNAATLAALQFHYLKYGDRFYFEHTGVEATSFTKVQLRSLRKSSLSRLLCDNANVKSIQKHALLLPGRKNPVVDCKRIAKVDLTPWKQQ